ncbi:MAG: DNA polymerase III subunit chi [Pseudomonadota bacterium]
MAEVRFYHLTETPLERALPTMLERTLARGGHAVVRGAHGERLGFLNSHLWTYDDAGLLPHGIEGDADAALQPIWLTTGTDRPNEAGTLFLIDGAEAGPDEMAALDVTAILFDGHDPAAVEQARGQWRGVTAAGLQAVYWAQTPDGGWTKKAESAASA